MQRAQPRRTDHPLPGLRSVGVDQFLRQAGQLRWITAAIEELIATVAGMADQVEDHSSATMHEALARDCIAHSAEKMDD